VKGSGEALTCFIPGKDEVLGIGAFGVVYKGKMNTLPVAVKTITPKADKVYVKSILSEIKVLIWIGSHENIVQLIGVNTKDLNCGLLFSLTRKYLIFLPKLNYIITL